MSRNLKFRVYNLDQLEMIYFQLHDVPVPDRYLMQNRYQVQQFTGLLDKNEVEIYEGDIIEFAYTTEHTLVGYVGYSELHACFSVTTGDTVKDFISLADHRSSFNVIGNIYENPELLSNTKKYKLIKTCGACPEQYDLVDDKGVQVAYLRLRNGRFKCVVPDVGGQIIYEASPEGDGWFTDEERPIYLKKAIEAVEKHYTKNEKTTSL